MIGELPAAPGDGWSSRFEDCILHGAVPVIIQDDVDTSFATMLDMDAISIRIAEKDCHLLPEVLLAVTPERFKAMQLAVSKVWHRFVYSSLPMFQRDIKAARNKTTLIEEPLSLPHQKLDGDPAEDDAFATIMQWLYSQIERTR